MVELLSNNNCVITAYAESDDGRTGCAYVTSRTGRPLHHPELRTDYLYLAALQRKTFTRQALEKFAAHPELFIQAYRNNAVEIYAVRQ